MTDQSVSSSPAVDSAGVRKARIREERRQAILDAAIPLFAANGFSDTGISEIAQAAGMSHGTVFLYFRNKEALFFSAVVEPLRDMERAFSFEETEGRPLQRLQQVIANHVRFVAHHRDYLRLVQYVLGHYERFQDSATEVLAQTERYGESLVALIRDGQRAGQLVPGDAHATALAYLGYINGIGLVVDVRGNQESPIWDAMAGLGLRLFGPTNMSDGTK